MKVGTDGVLLGAWAELEEAASILDIGTGTGLIALMASPKTGAYVFDERMVANEAVKDFFKK